MDKTFLINSMNFFSAQWVMWAAIAAYTALLIIDLVKRHTLSSSSVWYSVMLTMPAIFIYSTLCVMIHTTYGVTRIISVNNQLGSVEKMITSLLAAVILAVLMLVIFIRGNIFPLNKNKITSMSKESAGMAACKRLIFGGIVGIVIYSVIFALMFAEAVKYAEIMLSALPLMLVLLFFPILNIVSFVYFMCIGAIGAIILVFAIGVSFGVVLLINGCIRYSIRFNEKRGDKVLWSFFSVIPLFNIGLGVHYLAMAKSRAIPHTDCGTDTSVSP